MLDYDKIDIIKSRRKTLAIEIKPGGRVVVKAPASVFDRTVKAFVDEHEGWILKHLEKMRQREESRPPEPLLSDGDIQRLADEAMRVIPGRCRYYADLLGVSYGRITIRNQVTRWGSCTRDGNLNFNCLLMLTPPEVIDSVVVHELCHRLEMNHSKRFYAHVLSVFPDYKKWDKWLKDNGDGIMRRMTG
ncbi:MAG: M48 family metallopeptidase [Lachnospiraceae bacterium]|nr:M48 family metallopeptidase [Lachnospiraceae bacterium]